MRLHPARPASLLAVLSLAACSADRVAAPVDAGATARPKFALVNETGAPMVCNTTAPVVVDVTTIDRRGRTVPAPGVVVNFRAMNAATELFAGVGMTNSAGQVRDQITAGPTPGRAVSVEVRSVDAATGAAITHAALTRPIVMGPTAALTAEYYPSRYISAAIIVTIVPGCAVAGGPEPVLPAGTPVAVTAPNGTVSNVVMNGIDAGFPWFVGPATNPARGTYTFKVGSASTGILTLDFTV